MRKQEEEKEKENSERWLLTYSDMITLLLVLFIMMYTISTVDTNKFKAISQQLSIMLGDNTPLSVNAGTQGSNDEILNSFANVVTESPSPSTSLSPSPSSSLSGNAEEQDIEDKLKGLVKSSGLGTVVTIRNEQRGVVISFQEVLLFHSGSAEISDEGLEVLSKLADIIDSVDNYISVEGYTDNVPMHSFRFLSNWELASQRAINVLKQLIEYGVQPPRISATSYGENRPVVSNDTKENRGRNRRVDIIFIDEKFNSLQPGYDKN